MPLSYAQAVANLTAPGAPFELIHETIRGLPMRTFKNREKSMREKIANAGLRGETEFLVQGDQRISYGEFARRVWGTAAALRDEQGLRRGDRLAILSYNSPDWLIALFAATSVGGVALGLNGWWSTEEIEYGLRDGSTAGPTARVEFTTADRCLADCRDASSKPKKANWPDTPWDLDCESSTGCETYSPVFFSTKRLTGVATYVANGTSGVYKSADGFASNDGYYLLRQPGTEGASASADYQMIGADGLPVRRVIETVTIISKPGDEADPGESVKAFQLWTGSENVPPPDGWLPVLLESERLAVL